MPIREFSPNKAPKGSGAACDPDVSSMRNTAAMFLVAIAMIGQDLDYAALVDPALSAFADHTFQFDLQRSETRYPSFNLRKMLAGELIGCRTGLTGVIL